jgi:putative SOS response-associated peptidase YedK
MCGRFTLTLDETHLAERFNFEASEVSVQPSYNIAPGQQVLAVRRQETLQAVYLRWGLIPSWAKEARIGQRLINARSETVAEKPSFRAALRRRRCLIPADGFFEWQPAGASKIPMYIRRRDQQPFAFAGLWDTWQAPDGSALSTCTILTTEANTLVQPIHHRMPVILAPEAEAVWLDPQLHDAAHLLPVLVPYPAECMEAYAVSTLVNVPRHNTPACIAPR